MLLVTSRSFEVIEQSSARQERELNLGFEVSTERTLRHCASTFSQEKTILYVHTLDLVQIIDGVMLEV